MGTFIKLKQENITDLSMPSMMSYWYTTNCINQNNMIFHHSTNIMQERRCFENIRLHYINLLTFLMVLSLWNFDPEWGYHCILQYFCHEAFFFLRQVFIGIQKTLLWQDLKDLKQLQGTSKRLSEADEQKLFLLVLN